mmetsp:Transcript_9765/g.16443  ORF Transcript_9765/g.16443 Transcript_9765/m.16443 type:complete len:139 (-) Transcript_9765:110-526(-)
MQDSLGGNSKTLMFVNCSPSAYNASETKNSLEYAKRVKLIKNNPTLNMESKTLQKAKERMQQQQGMIEELKLLVSKSDHSQYLKDILMKYESIQSVGPRLAEEESKESQPNSARASFNRAEMMAARASMVKSARSIRN